MREDRAHLLVTLLPDRARLGPFVVPGTTACLRCLDAHLAEARPASAAWSSNSSRTTPGSPPPPCDPVLAQAALALAVRDLTSYAEADRPGNLVGHVDLRAGCAFPRRAWSRHPHCGCSWG